MPTQTRNPKGLLWEVAQLLIAVAFLLALLLAAMGMDQEIWRSLLQASEAVAGRIWQVAVAVAAIGVLSMALIQTAKDLLPLRRWFQRRRIGHWLRQAGQEADPGAAEEQLVRLSTAGDADAFYDLPIEQLCGQMNTAAQVALDYVGKYRDLVRCLGHSADPADLKELENPPRDVPARPREELPPEVRARLDAYVDARNRTSHHIQRAIDALQIHVGFTWKRALQFTSVILSAVVALGALRLWDRLQGTSTPWGVILVVGLLAGFLAPVARDLVAALESLRKK